MNIIRKTSTKHTSRYSNRSIDFICLHYTAGTRSAAGTAESVANMFATSNRDASADFIVDDATIVQYNGDIKNRYTWAVGGDKYAKMSTSLGGTLYGICKNSNSISIEMCSRKKNTNSMLATDKDWYFTTGVLRNTRELVRYLMKEYDVPIDHVVMHHHVNGKVCPNPWCVNEKALNWYYDFIKSLKDGGETEVDFDAMIADITSEQAYDIVSKAFSHMDKLEEPVWSKTDGHWERAKMHGVVDGSGPERPMKRDEVIAVLGRLNII